MSWHVFADPIETAVNGTTEIHQPLVFHSNVSILACRAWVVWYNDPTFDDICMKIYSDNDGDPGYLLHTSSVITKDYFVDDLYGVKEIPFEFSDKPVFKAEDTYHFVLLLSNYTGDSSSHLAWKRTFPDPPYRTGLDLTYEALLTYPYDLTFIGCILR